jgi:predicted Zn-dependent peptidase
MQKLSTFAGQFQTAIMMKNLNSERNISFHTLSNGIRIIHRQCIGEVSCSGFVVKAGTRDELDNEQGLAHFTEHMLFKGTPSRSSNNILNFMDKVGGEVNAYTTKEEIFLYSVFLRKDYERAIALMSDQFFNSDFPADEIDKEREVIMDEIDSYEDSPSELIFDDFEQLLFPNHPVGRRILGTEQCLGGITRKDFIDFHARNFTTDSIVYYSQSAMPMNNVVRLAEKYLGGIKASFRQGGGCTGNTVPVAARGVRKTIDKDTHQAHVIIGNTNFSLFEEEDRMCMYFINNILGGPGMNSRLNMALREKSALVYSVESGVTSFTDSGVFTVYFGTDTEHVNKSLKIVEKELRSFREKRLSDAQLHAAKRQLYGQILISSENKENQTLSMGKSMLYFNYYDSIDEIVAKIESITPDKIIEVASRIFAPEDLSVLIYK